MCRQRGFSLLEMLVVLLVVVVIVSLASLNTGSGAEERRLAEEVRFLADIAAYARDEAAFSGRDFGLLVGEELRGGERVTVLRFRERRLPGEREAMPGDEDAADGPLWERPRGDAELFEPLVFPASLDIELAIEGVPVALDRGGHRQEAATGGVPQVIFYASGEATPGTLVFRQAATGDFLWELRWDLLGRSEITDDPLGAGDA
ncbi:prepilin-type N-terminal cleavage/methylation domain-containing protein [Pseudohaliea rubra]|uniref:General secretion pathway protein H n=1 Tax=Pseudohaliea rubra DSM 19751 TaxID=1265313 RepID=A0A095VVI4_9GAMM|nr:prepilin-type N-terminal cleavage/methylation domain-containing protein [Pseudohaliea rubra]KGE05375.1 hypothetical protein HRUBRA_00055 [Pseudohaliea rubra DSM 19751]